MGYTAAMLSSYVREHVMRVFDHPHYFNVKPKEELLAAIDAGKSKFRTRDVTDYRMYEPKYMVRYKAAAAHFPEAFKGSVADIGDRNGSINTLIDSKAATVDKNNSDLESFDWDKEKLPFKDGEFDSVFCLDTLEHITDIHSSFDDLLRISRDHVVVSLPNCWKKTPKEIWRGRGMRNSYGLPVEKPMDRHRWYMNTEDIEDFYFYNAKKNGFETVGLMYFAPKIASWHALYPLLRLLLPERHFKNLVVTTVFVHLRRKAKSA